LKKSANRIIEVTLLRKTKKGLKGNWLKLQEDKVYNPQLIQTKALLENKNPNKIHLIDLALPLLDNTQTQDRKNQSWSRKVKLKERDVNVIWRKKLEGKLTFTRKRNMLTKLRIQCTYVRTKRKIKFMKKNLLKSSNLDLIEKVSSKDRMNNGVITKIAPKRSSKLT